MDGGRENYFIGEAKIQTKMIKYALHTTHSLEKGYK